MYTSSVLLKFVPDHIMLGSGGQASVAGEQNLTVPIEYDKYVYVAYGFYVILIFILGMVQNSLTLFVFIQDRRLNKLHNYFIVGLAISDVGMCLCGHWMIIVSSFTRKWEFNRAGIYMCVFLMKDASSTLHKFKIAFA